MSGINPLLVLTTAVLVSFGTDSTLNSNSNRCEKKEKYVVLSTEAEVKSLDFDRKIYWM